MTEQDKQAEIFKNLEHFYQDIKEQFPTLGKYDFSKDYDLKIMDLKNKKIEVEEPTQGLIVFTYDEKGSNND